MKPGRLEAFSDGVIAIIITIMVLQMTPPKEISLEELFGIAPVFMSYVLSFIYVGIYWNNHHHLMQVTKKVNGRILWANLHLLFWLSLIPFTTSWAGENDHYTEPLPVIVYGSVLILSAIAYFILERSLKKYHDKDYALNKLSKKNKFKDYASMIFYLLAIPMAFVNTWISIACYVLVALLWLMPTSQLERLMEE